ncbi:MAG: tRNA (adenosine(37)-N6)-threonylcarbamoyltransferase complex transferase subunit TsaD [Candidatus Margulisbacteria bacterium]|nr:tRNA (adenosine(37)-N6)-threonylcarbamoyltransferase complex transferase subunit TsaD [Candidatus Margulisiibacteriota bacterium]MBU1616284.1 tRNA (adenosine(37)-N6)-threonylcarbamoyltransferase complex transferase subunit TsaD [Candidatus Margulisiibacteriota bacterium]
MNILAIETSCDETSAAVVKDGREVLSNVIASQIEFHKKYGGIVPEVASRLHAECISLIIKDALDRAGKETKEIDAIAVTYGPGLVGSLIVGVSAAKALAYSLKKPLIGVNHLEGHIYANFLEGSSDSMPGTLDASFPFITLLVSGGHTSLVLVKGHGDYETVGQTRDDAAGEAYDKVARFLKIGYPGGPIIDKLAKEGNPDAIHFKRPMIEEEFGLDFSFSGLKTAVVNYVSRLPDPSSLIPDLCASFQAAAIDVLVEKSLKAAELYKCETIALAGGVSANSALRRELKAKAEAKGLAVHIPPFEYCTDNAAMIGAAGHYKRDHSSFSLSPVASARI